MTRRPISSTALLLGLADGYPTGGASWDNNGIWSHWTVLFGDKGAVVMEHHWRAGVEVADFVCHYAFKPGVPVPAIDRESEIAAEGPAALVVGGNHDVPRRSVFWLKLRRILGAFPQDLPHPRAHCGVEGFLEIDRSGVVVGVAVRRAVKTTKTAARSALASLAISRTRLRVLMASLRSTATSVGSLRRPLGW